MSSAELPTWHLAVIVEVPFEDRVQCQCRTCGHAVYKRVHIIVWGDGRIECWGQDCYKRGLGVTPAGRASKAICDSIGGRKLTPEERELLRSNREQLIAKFCQEQEQKKTQAERRREEVLRRVAEGQKRWCRAPQVRSGGSLSDAYRSSQSVDRRPPPTVINSHPDEYLLEREGTCKYCGKKTTDWQWFFGKTGTCVCRDCYRQGKAG